MEAFHSLMKGLSSGSGQHFCSHLGPALCTHIQTFSNLFALVSSSDMPGSAFRLWRLRDVTNV